MTYTDRPTSRSGLRQLGVAALVVGVFVGGLAIATSLQVPGQNTDGLALRGEVGTVAAAGLVEPLRLPPVSAANVAGIWFSDSGVGTPGTSTIVRFAADGSFALGGASARDAHTTGRYQVRSRGISGVTFTPAGGECGSGPGFAWHLTMLADGVMEAVHLGTAAESAEAADDCAIPVGETYRFTRISPVSTNSFGIQPGYRKPAGAIETRDRLAGYWLIAGTGTVLRVDATGGYTLFGSANEANSVDSGATQVDPGTVRFLSDGTGSGCALGASMTWENVRIEDGTLRATVTGDACGHEVGHDVVGLYLDVDQQRADVDVALVN